MAVTHWWLGEPTETSAMIACRSNATAAVSVACNGSTFTGSANTAVNDGVCQIVVTGLQPDRRYAYSIDGVQAGTLRTKKTTGDVWIATGSCWAQDKADILAYQLLQDYDIDLYIALGDFPYCNTQKNTWGENCVDVESSVAAGKNFENYAAHHRQVRAMPGMAEMMRNVPLLYMPDDHEYPFNNAAPADLSGYRATVTGAGSATQEDLDDAWSIAKSAIDAYTLGNWTVGFDSNAAAVDADAIYGSYKIGQVEVFLIDCINYRHPATTVDTGGKTMLGAAQKARLIDAVQSSTAAFKFIASGKQWFSGGGNDDCWVGVGSGQGYVTERNEILYALRDVTGLLIAAGDQHAWSDQWVGAGDLGTDYPAISCLVGCPTSVRQNPDGVTGYPTGVRSKVGGYPFDISPPTDNVVALYRFTGTRVYRYLLSLCSGLISCGHIDAGSNQVQYQRARIG